LYYAALEHGDRIDPEAVMPSVSWKTAKQRIKEAPAEPSKT
jgi:hypothetical protein